VADNATVSVSDMKMWNMESVNVWPERPRNSSSALLYDSPEETNNYVWWTGN
jgi:beta-fructofuranosidase